MTDAAPRPPLASVALLSSAALGAEILLTRLFAVVHWHHFAYMIISLALLGVGASGTFLALAQRRLLQRYATCYLAAALAFSVTVVGAPVLAGAAPLEAEALLWDATQPAWLLLVFLLLSLPFFCAATAIGLVLFVASANAGRVYAADLLGAGLGSVAVLALLYRLWPEDVLRMLAVAGLLATAVGAFELRARPAAWLAVAAAGLVLLAMVPAEVLRLEPGPYKPLSEALRVPGTRVMLERSSPLGRISLVESPRVPLRWAPGLSLGSTSEPPPQLGIFTDGADLQAVTAASTDPDRLAFLGQVTSALAFRVARPRSVLVVGAGGGMEALRASRLGAHHVDVIELNPQVAHLLRRELRAYSGGLFDTPTVRLIVGDVRSLLAAGTRRYDLIQMSFTSAGSAGGLGGLNEDYLHTVEAFELYLEHLAPGGLLSITRWAQVPPRDALKLVATARAALEADGAADVGQRLMMLRGWQTVTLLVKNGHVTPAEVRRLREFCDELSFDAAWFPGIRRADTNVYNRLAADWYHDGVRALLGSERDEYIADYPFDIRPATDQRPYFNNFFRWPVFVQAWQGRDRGSMALLEAGYLLLVVTVGVALVAGLALIVLPLAKLSSHTRAPRGLRWRVLGYFTGIGLAFLFVEIVFLQKMVLLVHHPTVALAVTLATFLVGAGAGSAWSSRMAPSQGPRTLVVAVAGIAVWGVVGALALDALEPVLAAWSLPTRALVGGALLAPLAFGMGMPFPLALRELDGALVPWAWGINGCASVVSAPLGTLLAVEVGFSVVLGCAIALYLVMPWVFPRSRRVQPPT